MWGMHVMQVAEMKRESSPGEKFIYTETAFQLLGDFHEFAKAGAS